MFIGVDIGGTFTDFVLSADGRLCIYKVLSTPHDPAQAMLSGLAAVSPEGVMAITRISHGSTVATNAILERKGAPTALITTQGFRDILAIGRQDRPVLYALQPQLPPPLIPRRWCYEVPERLDHSGAVLMALDMNALDVVLDDLVDQGIASVAVCFLYSYVNPVHEQAVRARILERGLFREEQVALSCEVLPEFREYERASTVALEAYVRPVVGGYLQRLEGELCPELCGEVPSPPLVEHMASPARGTPGERSSKGTGLRIMKSDGGAISARRAGNRLFRPY